MKRIILTLTVLFIAINIYSQTRPTGKVKKTFSKKYENAEIVKWVSETERNRVTVWKVFFKQNDTLSVAWYDPKANWIQTKTEISKEELPPAVLKSINESYQQYKIVIAARFKNPEAEGYEVFLSSSELDGFDVQFSKDGEALNRTIRSGGYQPIDSNGNEIEK